MASRVVDMTSDTARALQECDAKRAARAGRGDAKIHRDESKIESLCSSVLTRFRLSSSELRFVTVALKLVADLDKVGVLCASICPRIARLSEGQTKHVTASVQELTDEVSAMVRDAIDAFVDRDTDLAVAVAQRDDRVDQIYSDTIDEIARLMEKKKLSPQQGIDLLSASKSLERIADHAARVAEHVVYLIEGKDLRHG